MVEGPIGAGKTSLAKRLGARLSGDLILEDPNGNMIFEGATPNAPEEVSIANPTAGIWTASIFSTARQ